MWRAHSGRQPGGILRSVFACAGFACAGFAESGWAAGRHCSDTIFITFAGQFRPTTTPGVLENVETFEIVGGTGRFLDATGSGIAGGLVDAMLTPLTPAPFTATISSPGSHKR
jgi:hypothetical protein